MAEPPAAHFVETLTGFKWLCRPGLAHPEWTQVLLYEEALGYAVGADARDKDGITAALAVADCACAVATAGPHASGTSSTTSPVAHGAHVTHNGSIRSAGPGWRTAGGLVDRLVADPPDDAGRPRRRPAPTVPATTCCGCG